MRTVEEIEQDIAVANAHNEDALWLEWFRAVANGIEPSRLREICDAERDGRCVVLPCKMGTTLYKTVINRREPKSSYVLEYQFGWHTYTATIDGLKHKIVFLTRAEAEAAKQ